MPDRIYNVLFLCTANSARSIIAEAILRQRGAGRFRAHSAGSRPAAAVDPLTIAFLERHRIDTAGLRAKNWAEFAAPGAAAMDFVLTVCDKAAGETCPVWPGQPVTAHWGVDDPLAAGNDEKKSKAIAGAYFVLNRRIELFLSLPLEKLDRLALRRELTAIGKLGASAESAAASK